jgi:hypothetical protein
MGSKVRPQMKKEATSKRKELKRMTSDEKEAILKHEGLKKDLQRKMGQL